jgi:2-polyprenyl-6-methoxyphenol hydroxylase-like FAD-dependent oxidoreductase
VRIFLAGAAAPFIYPQAAALNVGLQDAINFDCKLAGAIRELVHDILLDRYANERVPIAASLATNPVLRLFC